MGAFSLIVVINLLNRVRKMSALPSEHRLCALLAIAEALDLKSLECHGKVEAYFAKIKAAKALVDVACTESEAVIAKAAFEVVVRRFFEEESTLKKELAAMKETLAALRACGEAAIRSNN